MIGSQETELKGLMTSKGAGSRIAEAEKCLEGAFEK
jgi:hypothetical protein